MRMCGMPIKYRLTSHHLHNVTPHTIRESPNVSCINANISIKVLFLHERCVIEVYYRHLK